MRAIKLAKEFLSKNPSQGDINVYYIQSNSIDSQFKMNAAFDKGIRSVLYDYISEDLKNVI